MQAFGSELHTPSRLLGVFAPLSFGPRKGVKNPHKTESDITIPGVSKCCLEPSITHSPKLIFKNL